LGVIWKARPLGPRAPGPAAAPTPGQAKFAFFLLVLVACGQRGIAVAAAVAVAKQVLVLELKQEAGCHREVCAKRGARCGGREWQHSRSTGY
jgi:hypothetical protein